MQTKLQMYQEVSEQASKRLWNDTDYFRSFLVTSARLYKYRFKDQKALHDLDCPWRPADVGQTLRTLFVLTAICA